MSRELEKLRKKIEKSYGEGSVFYADEIPESHYVPTGSLSLDFAIGTGGFPHNRAIEIAGEEGSGKTTLGLIAGASFLRHYPEKAMLILDVEHKITKSWVETIVGSDLLPRILLLWPDTVEQATDMYTEACKSGQICYVLFDSIGGAPTQRVANKSAESGNVGGNALGVSRFAQFASIYSNKYSVCTVGVNQAREDMAGYRRLITPGGRAWKHACILRIHLKRGQLKYFAKVDGEELQVGYSVVAKIIKNQMAAPGRVAWWPFLNVETEKYGFGIDRLSEISRLALAVGVIEQRGAWYYHEDLPDGKIKSQARLYDYLKETEEFQEKISKQVIDSVVEKGLREVAPSIPEGEEGVEVGDTSSSYLEELSEQDLRDIEDVEA